MDKLQLWETYSRRDVHDIFSPETTFTPQAGTWGLQGIVGLPDKPGSFVFFVTFGRVQGGHAFDESITTEGVLTWQSQPDQRLQAPMIKSFIGHNSQSDAIHLFLRTKAQSPYTYMGRLGYLTHDADREQPVHFQWQLLDWPAPIATISAAGLKLVPAYPQADSVIDGEGPPGLVEDPPPPGIVAGPSKTPKFQATKQAIHPDRDARNRSLGLAGEELVLQDERKRLVAAGRADLAEAVVHTSVVEGDGAGYDIKSFTATGDVRYLEVKTTRSGPNAGFFISPNEVAFSESHPDAFVLVRVYLYDAASKRGRCYRVGGPISASFQLVASEFRARLQG